MVDSNGMAKLHGIQDLQEDGLGHEVIPDKLTLLSDVGEQITFRAILDDHEGAVMGVQDLYQRDNVRVEAGPVVQFNLPLLESLLARLCMEFVESLDRVWCVGLQVHGRVNDAVGSDTKNTTQLQSPGKDLAKAVLRSNCESICWGWRWWRSREHPGGSGCDGGRCRPWVLSSKTSTDRKKNPKEMVQMGEGPVVLTGRRCRGNGWCEDVYGGIAEGKATKV